MATIVRGDYLNKVADAMPEAELLRAVRDIAGALGWRVYHTHRSDRSEAGWPDVALTRGRRFMARELKSTKGRLTAAQLAWLADLKAAGVDAGIWRPMDLLDGTILTQLQAAEAPDLGRIIDRLWEACDGAESEGQGFLPVSTIRAALGGL